jgi:ribonuclease E
VRPAEPKAQAATPEPVGDGETPPTRTRTTRSRTSRARAAAKPKEEQPKPAEPAATPEPVRPARRRKAAEADPAAAEARPTRTRRSRTVGGRRRREPGPVIRRAEDKTMLITQLGERDQIAVLEGRTLVEHYITRSGAKSMVGNIYLGKVQNVLPGMEAAFIDVGRGRNAVLYAGEVSYDEDIDGEAPRIEKVLKSGQNVLVQVTKDPIGGKGARLTQEISLPGRYLVFVPNSQVFGISRRLPDKERQRLKDILKQIHQPEHGLIVRTAAEGADEDDLRADLIRLQEEWAVIDKSRKRGRAPRVLYEEPELTIRVVRDLFTGGEFKEIVTDSKEMYDRVVSYLQTVAPELIAKVHMHEGPLPLLEAHHALEQIHKALDRKVWLPSGGYIIVDKTEAMTVIDVNTGKHVGKANLEETVTKTNVEAAEEIARQLRLRDIGGIIIIDFIDMLFERNKQKVIDTLKNALAQDKTRSQVFDIGPLGLLEVTRKRVSAGLLEAFSETCPTCEGRGIILTHKL